jgi:hypothetical protein
MVAKVLCAVGLKLSEPQARRLNNDVTTSSCAKHTGDPGSGFEALSIGNCRSLSSLPELATLSKKAATRAAFIFNST